MKRLWVAAALASSAASAQQEDFSKVEIKATQVAGSVWMLAGSGGNIAVSAGPRLGAIRQVVIDRPFGGPGKKDTNAQPISP